MDKRNCQMGADGCTSKHTYAHTRKRTLSMLCVLIFVSFSLNYSGFSDSFAFGTARTWPHTEEEAYRFLFIYARTFVACMCCVCIHIALAIRFDSIYSFTECVPSSYIHAKNESGANKPNRTKQTEWRLRRRHQMCLCIGRYVRGFLQLLLLACCYFYIAILLMRPY